VLYPISTFIILSTLFVCSIRKYDEAMLTTRSAVPCKVRKGIWISGTLRCIERCALIVARVHFALMPWWYTKGSPCLSWTWNRTNDRTYNKLQPVLVQFLLQYYHSVWLLYSPIWLYQKDELYRFVSCAIQNVTFKITLKTSYVTKTTFMDNIISCNIE